LIIRKEEEKLPKGIFGPQTNAVMNATPGRKSIRISFITITPVEIKLIESSQGQSASAWERVLEEDLYI
jgi:hypothetical protein